MHFYLFCRFSQMKYSGDLALPPSIEWKSDILLFWFTHTHTHTYTHTDTHTHTHYLTTFVCVWVYLRETLLRCPSFLYKSRLRDFHFHHSVEEVVMVIARESLTVSESVLLSPSSFDNGQHRGKQFYGQGWLIRYSRLDS